MISEVVQAFVLLFIIMDPFASLPVFLTVTKKFKDLEKKKAADHAVLVAGLLVFPFIAFGDGILGLMQISLYEFQIAGGFILFLLGIEMVLSREDSEHDFAKDYKVAAVIVSTPLITGPGTIATSIVLAKKVGALNTAVAAVLSLVAIWLLFRQAARIKKVLGESGIAVVSRIMGLVVASIAVGIMLEGLNEAGVISLASSL
jgi:multiple antibiotic resistance protein